MACLKMVVCGTVSDRAKRALKTCLVRNAGRGKDDPAKRSGDANVGERRVIFRVEAGVMRMKRARRRWFRWLKLASRRSWWPQLDIGDLVLQIYVYRWVTQVTETPNLAGLVPPSGRHSRVYEGQHLVI